MQKKYLYIISIISILYTSWIILGVTFTPSYIRISGSTTCLPIVDACAEYYMEKNDDIDIQVSGGGSSVGMTNVGEGIVNIGMMSREPKDEELKKYPDLKFYYIAMDAICVIVNKRNNLDDIEKDDLEEIFQGEIEEWNELTGSNLNGEIVSLGRDSNSGTRKTFEAEIGINDPDYDEELDSNGAIVKEVSGNENAIGYVGYGYTEEDEGIKAIGIDGKIPNEKNVHSEEYKLSRYLIVLVKGEPSGHVKKFITFIRSDKGQEIVKSEGFFKLPEDYKDPEFY
ncbi:MAG: phosphate ABC transporter substrate-binding protein [Promethearchaeota archaeon]